MSSDDIPTLASLRRRVPGKARGSGQRSTRGSEGWRPSLFDTPAANAEVPTRHEETVQPHATGITYLPHEIPVPQSIATGSASESTTPGKVEPSTKVWSVAALVREVRSLVERSYGRVTVEGEISNWRPAGSGHCYFTLKDGDAQLSAVMFRKNASLLRFRPKDGDAVRLRGQISVYENRGQMQLIAESIELAGQGALLAAVQELKERLRREGLFERKRPLPPFPKCIGVITSVKGLALSDIVKVCRRRHAAVNLLIYPVSVQGAHCTGEVRAALRWFSRHRDRADVVILARGGGSWEDLHGFDDEGIARAIVACELPVISGIGHATDTTIADAAADVCAPTPSAAAEIVTAAHHRVEERVDRLRARVLRAGSHQMFRIRQRFWAAGAEATGRRSLESIRQREQRVDELGFRAEGAIARSRQSRHDHLARMEVRLQRQNAAVRVLRAKQRLDQIFFRLEAAGTRLTLERRATTSHCIARLGALNPFKVLERGYALVYAANGTLLRSAEDADVGDVITARLAKGKLRAAVLGLDSEQ